MPQSDYMNADMGAIWVQPDGPNTEPKLLICENLDGFEESYGDTTTRLCRTPAGWIVSSRAQGAPSEVTFSIEGYHIKTRTWLQLQAERRCPMPVYLHQGCQPQDVFLNYLVGQLGKNAVITKRSGTGRVRGMADAGDGAADASKNKYDLTAEPGAPEYWKLIVNPHIFAEAETLRDIAFNMSARCHGVCGTAVNKCTDGTIVPNATALSKADVWGTTSSGVAWAAAAAQPFAASENIATDVRFLVDNDVTRIIVGCGTAAAAGLRIAYSDDEGVTWAVVQISNSATDYFMHGGGLFALDSHHIWGCTHDGLVYFSSDAGVTWASQGVPTPGGGAEPLYCIRFRDENYGMCVGGTTGVSGVLLTTTDSGAHWYLGTSANAEAGTGVDVIDSYRAWVTFADGTIYCTNDYGATWTDRTPRLAVLATPTKLGDVQFYDEFMGAVVGYKTVSTDEFAVVWRTFDGGYDWEAYVHLVAFDTTPTMFGLNSVWICDYNHIWAVGEAVDGTGLALELAP